MKMHELDGILHCQMRFSKIRPVCDSLSESLTYLDMSQNWTTGRERVFKIHDEKKDSDRLCEDAQ